MAMQPPSSPLKARPTSPTGPRPPAARGDGGASAAAPTSATQDASEPRSPRASARLQQAQQQAQEQTQQQDAAPAQPAPLPRAHGREARPARRGAEPAGRRAVSFAPGPWADRYGTDDGHPDHEGQLARPQRSVRTTSWGFDLTTSAVRAVEKALGEDCRPSIDRLKRRVGLLPLRKRPFEYWLNINGSDEEKAAQRAYRHKGAAAGEAEEQACSAEEGEDADDDEAPAAAQPQQQPAAEAASGSGRQHDSARSVGPKTAAGAGAPGAKGSASRKRGQPEAGAQPNGATKRAHQRLGGLSGPVGTLRGKMSKDAK